MSEIRPTAPAPAPAETGIETGTEPGSTSLVDQVLAPVTPHLRGWLHAGMAPVSLILGIVLVVLSPAEYRWAAELYSLTAIALFGTTPARQPSMGPLGESQGPPAFPALVPSFVCHPLPNGPGLAPSQYSAQ